MNPRAELLHFVTSKASLRAIEAPVDEPARVPSLPDLETLPLCVDLDGTLLTSDTTCEAIVSSALDDWRSALRLPFWFSQGRAHLKRQLAARWHFDPALLPYNEALLCLLRQERAHGRRLVLATAADEAIARPIARYLGLFDEVIASDGVNNLRGSAKADVLCRRFGRRRFVYVGNDAADHAVWREAAAAILVNTTAAVKHAALAEHRVLLVVERNNRGWSAAIDALRPYQWTKNLLALVPLFASGDLSSAVAWWNTLGVMLAFCAMASAIYVLNDMGDLAADRAHPRKRKRPLASGRLSLAAASAMIPVLSATALELAIVSGALTAVLVYAALSLAYTLRLKEMPLIDVFVLAGLYTIRMYGGSEASGYLLSEWLLGFSAFLFLSLALVKRVSELSRLRATAQARTQRRGYLVEDLPTLQMLGISTTLASSVVLSLYVQSEKASSLYERPDLLLLLVPLLMFWQCRLWLATARGYMHDDPIVFAARDWVSWCVFLGTAAALLAAKMPL